MTRQVKTKTSDGQTSHGQTSDDAWYDRRANSRAFRLF